MRVETTVPLRTQERNKPLIFSEFVDDCERGRTGEWWPRTESNHRHADFQSAALPTELLGHRRPEPGEGFGGTGWEARGRVLERAGAAPVKGSERFCSARG